VARWITALAQQHGKAIDELSFVFCRDHEILYLNKTHLQHDYYTDILTFPYGYDPISAEVYISVDRITENASAHGVSDVEELRRVIIHGLFHMLGFRDESEEQQQAMRLLEDNALIEYEDE